MAKLSDKSIGWDSLAAAAVTAAAVAVWFKLVADIVPAPYLDEVFHVRQAAQYAQGNWRVWDPKITTPPGLYLASCLQIKLFLFRDIMDAKDFRSTNAIGSIFLVEVVRRLLLLTGARDESVESKEGLKQWRVAELVHNTVNICLFPPLFFFYALYYTDVLSALSVLYAYESYLEKRNGFHTVFAGLLSLLFRQTNIFWVSLFLGGLAFCRTVPRGQPGVEFASEPGLYDVMQGSWQHASAYDPLVSEAGFEDYVKSGASFAIAGFLNLQLVLWNLVPYLFILAFFSGFVVRNGGVVLGDKENHIVSIHLAQMLYIWPYIVFFSIPLLYPYLLNILVPQRWIPSALRSSTIRQRSPRIIVGLPIIGLMLVIAHYNTIIHPFTLADNRHYTFYVFRILLRHPLLKYLAVPVYFLCAWAVISALGGRPPQPVQMSARKREKQPQSRVSRSAPAVALEKEHRVSFLLVWLLATSASVITAPLVEPRYFIVPWLIWRLHVVDSGPANPTSASQVSDVATRENFQIKENAPAKVHDHRLWLETAWFLLINAAIGYIFLYWGFEWPQEPGRVQRFMW